MEEIISKLLDLNERTEGSYSIKITRNGVILLMNYQNIIVVAQSVQDLREEMYRLILKKQ